MAVFQLYFFAVNPGQGEPDHQRAGHVRQCVRTACLASVARGEVRSGVKDVVTGCGLSMTCCLDLSLLIIIVMQTNGKAC